MPDPSPALIDPATVRRLARLVTGLTLVMILGIITVVALLAVRLNRSSALPLPDQITLPDGVTAEAVTLTPDHVLVVSADILFVYDRATGQLQKQISLTDAK
jgi:hypothetical protein